MKITLTNILIGAVVLLSLAGWKLYNDWQYEKTERKNAQSIVVALQDTITYRTVNGKTIANINTINATKDNVKLVVDNQIKELVGNVKNLQAYIKAGYGTTNNFSTTIRDSIVYVDSTKNTARTFSFNDGFLNQTCTMLGNVSNCSYIYTDSITAITYLKKDYKWFQFWKWGNKTSNTDILFKNPNTKLINIKSVLVK